jgi:two-component system, OmpR family, sensor histidine kinase KdpD
LNHRIHRKAAYDAPPRRRRFFTFRSNEMVGSRLHLRRIPILSFLGANPPRSPELRWLQFVLECMLGGATVVLLTAPLPWSGWLLPVPLLFSLLVVAAMAWLCGFWQALIVSLLAVSTNYAFKARPLEFGVSSGWAIGFANFLILLVFILIALAASRLAARLARYAAEAKSWNEQMMDLYEFTRRTLKLNLQLEPGQQLAELVHDVFALEAVAIFDSDLHRVYQAGYWSADPTEMAQNVYYFENADDDPVTGLGRRVVRLGTVPIGSLVVRGNTNPLTNDAITSLIAITFDRYRAFANESRIETERRTEQLRATVLDSLAHAYKTPLTAIRAASTGLNEMGHLSPAQADLVALIDEQANLLGSLTTRLLTTARLDGGEVTLHAKPVGVASLIEEIVASFGDRLASMKVVIDLSDENMTLNCDRQLMVMLLTQYIDNACKYSIYGTAITIHAEQTRAETVFSVRSYGPVIPLNDRERIFDRYYRSATHAGAGANRTTGTGIGLSVAKRVAGIHGGSVWVTSDEVEGTTFFAAIPLSTQKRGS